MSSIEARSQMCMALDELGYPYIAKAVRDGRITAQAAFYSVMDAYRPSYIETQYIQKFLVAAKHWKI